MNDEKQRLLIAHSGADLYVDELRRRYPQLEIGVARHGEELAAVLEPLRPTLAYSCTSSSFMRHLHRPIADVPELRWLHVGGAGFEHFAGFDASRITLSNGRGVLAEFQADTIMGAIIALNHDFAAFAREQAAARFSPRAVRALAGQKLAIVGPGAIGSAVARRARAHGLHVIAISRRVEKVSGFDEVRPLADLAASLADVDIVSLHLPLTDETRHRIDARVLAALRDDAILVNTARGAVIDEQALIATLRAGRLRGVYLDVFEKEPLPADSPLWQMERVMLTPHCCDQVTDWEDRHAAFFFDNLHRYLNNQPLYNIVSRPA